MRCRAERWQRSGFTIIELLVILAIIATLGGMLFPVIQRVREASARAECGNNLKQIGIGFQNYHGVMGHFPPGGTHLRPKYPHSAPPSRRDLWSWGYHILPYIGEERIHDLRDPNEIAVQAIRAYYCPSRRSPGLYGGQAKIDYAGNAGTEPNGRNGIVMRTGFGVCSRRDVLDGASNTFMVSEKQMDLSRMGRSEDDDEPYTTPGWNNDMDVYRFGHSSPVRDVLSPEGCVMSPSKFFGSSHASGINVLFVDGAVRQIRYTVSRAAFRSVSVRDDRSNYDPDEF